MKTSTRIALVGDYKPEVIAHQAIPKALEMVANSADCNCWASWIGTQDWSQSLVINSPGSMAFGVFRPLLIGA